MQVKFEYGHDPMIFWQELFLLKKCLVSALLRLIGFCFCFLFWFINSHTSNFSATGIWWLSHCWWHGCKFRPMLCAKGLWAGRDLYGATPTAIRGIGLYDLIGKTNTHVPQWHSNPRRKDHHIFAPDSLTTAPRGWLTYIRLKLHI
jgi:hypothetical protein